MHLDVYESIWFKLCLMIDAIEHFETSLGDLDLDSEREKNTAALIKVHNLDGLFKTVEIY